MRWNEARRANAARYARLFAEARATHVMLPVEPQGYHHIYHQYVVRVPDRDAVRERLTKAGIGCEVYYPVPLHRQDCFTGLGHREGSFPVSEAAAREVLALPIYAELTEEQQRAVVAAVRGQESVLKRSS
jgi:dTDP-4-amino-4,6-dideoxygalactose transaminase